MLPPNIVKPSIGWVICETFELLLHRRRKTRAIYQRVLWQLFFPCLIYVNLHAQVKVLLLALVELY
jgi:hypothetical protein